MTKHILKPPKHTAKQRAQFEEVIVQYHAANDALQELYRVALTAYWGRNDFKALMREAKRKPKGTAKTRK